MAGSEDVSIIQKDYTKPVPNPGLRFGNTCKSENDKENGIGDRKVG
jgi:hypothetical protein